MINLIYKYRYIIVAVQCFAFEGIVLTAKYIPIEIRLAVLGSLAIMLGITAWLLLSVIPKLIKMSM